MAKEERNTKRFSEPIHIVTGKENIARVKANLKRLMKIDFEKEIQAGANN